MAFGFTVVVHRLHGMMGDHMNQDVATSDTKMKLSFTPDPLTDLPQYFSRT